MSSKVEISGNMAYFAEENDEMILRDPAVAGLMRAVAENDCSLFFQANADRVEHFRRRLQERGLSPKEHCMVVADVDDEFGRLIADATMPGHDWNQYYIQSMKPVARGLVDRVWLEGVIEAFDKNAAEQCAAPKASLLSRSATVLP